MKTKTQTQTIVSLIAATRVIFDRVWNRKNYFEIPTFLQFEQGITRAEKIKVLLHFPKTEICLSVFVFSFEFPDLVVPHSKLKKGGNYKIIFSTPYPSIYYPGSY